MKRTVCIAVGLIVFLGFLTGVGAQQKKQVWTDPVTTFRPATAAEEKAIITNLQLSDKQRTEMGKLNQGYRAEVQALANRYQKARQDLITTLEQPEPDPDRVTSQLQKVHQTHSAMLKKEVAYWNSCTYILTKDQASDFWALFAKSRLK